MSTHKWIDRICVAAVVLSLLLTLAFMNGRALGLQSTGKTIGYENRLFDSSRVHTVDIIMEDWDGFIETCQSEKYSVCSVVIDGESYKNVGIRGKGNTSLSSVASMGSSRYSFKIEFDQYDSAKSYHGLDKLSLNNLIQDNTMMKDYLTYQMMNAFGVASPLCSFVYITVNGEDWGLYLAVEGVEEAFLQRNYGSDYGELYKPDSMSFGGGRGNGRDFDIDNFAVSDEKDGDTSGQPVQPDQPGQPDQAGNMPDLGNFTPPSMSDSSGNAENPGWAAPAGQGAMQPPSTPPDGVDAGDFDPSSMFGGGGFSFGSASDVKLQYIDDDPDSYANIFDSAKTDVSKADQARLITSLKSLSGYEDLENILDMDAVLRYFVVHSFVVNGDSYTGNMIHNYYLYEEDGRLSMIPWDYNLAFGTFMGGAATSSVNDAIDDALSDRPMQAWIFSDETYTQQYHELYSEFLSTVDMAQIIDDAYTLIAGYVEKDPTKFCTYEEFETGVQTLKTFCSLRRESVSGQLEGTVPATSEAQNANPAALVNADDLNLSDMGTMNNGGDGGFGGPGGFGGGGGQTPPTAEGQTAGAPTQVSDDPMGQAGSSPTDPDAQQTERSFPSRESSGGRNASPPGGGFAPTDRQPDPASQRSGMILLGLSIITLLIGLVIAGKFRR